MKKFIVLTILFIVSCTCKEKSMDCAGIVGGQSSKDNCGICDSDPSNDCIQDCNNIWGGDLIEDECGVCGGDNSSCFDCAGVPNGNLKLDECGVCGGDNSSCFDCAGVPNGNLKLDECGVCGGNGDKCGKSPKDCIEILNELTELSTSFNEMINIFFKSRSGNLDLCNKYVSTLQLAVDQECEICPEDSEPCLDNGSNDEVCCDNFTQEGVNQLAKVCTSMR